MNSYRTYGHSYGYNNGLRNWRTARPSPPNNQRPYFPPGRHRPEYDNLYWKLKFYSEDDDAMAKSRNKSALDVDYLYSDNSESHHTQLYGVKGLVVRRGQEFVLRIKIKVPFDFENDKIRLLFCMGDKPQESKGTLVRADVHMRDTPEYNSSWRAWVIAVNQKEAAPVLDLVVDTPSDALVGIYKLQVKLFTTNPKTKDPVTITKDEELPVYLLFNAWCKDDQVYLTNEEERSEYVLNETGRIWIGTANKNVGRPWNFGQFSRFSLGAAFHLLNKCKYIHDRGHGNATLVCRALSAMANKCSDADDGVLVGNWSGKYDGGTSPTQWNGSQAILEEYMLKKQPVKFGQCWVFSGLLTTLGRTLGIPTRSVTNFESAHDKDISMTIDSHYDFCGKPLSKMDDSVWNFHVWNESWFKRPDLPDGYDGWQAYDATPQESSEGIYQCGPASVKAIKEGNVYLGYDTKFIFAEVNGDRMTWIVLPESGDMYSLSDRTQTESVGKCISTKMIGSSHRNDLTVLYKYPEGSQEERKTVAKASRFSSRKNHLQYVFKQNQTDVRFDYSGKAENNGDVTIRLKMENTSKEEIRKVSVSVTLHAAYYTGIPAEELCHDTVHITLQPEENKEKDWSLEAKDYLNIIDEDAKLKLYLMANVEGTKQVFTMQDMFEIDKPELVLQTTEKNPKVGDNFEVVVRLVNPLSIKLTNGIILLEGNGIQKHLKIPLHRSLNPGEELIKSVTLRAKYPGTREIIGNFHSKQLTGITGAVEIQAQFREAVYV